MRDKLIDWNKINPNLLGDYDLDSIFNAIEEHTTVEHERGRYKIEYDRFNSCSIWSSHGQVLARVGNNMMEICYPNTPAHYAHDDRLWVLVRNNNWKLMDVFFQSCYLTTPHEIRFLKKRNDSKNLSYVLYADGEPVGDFDSIFVTRERVAGHPIGKFKKKRETELFSWATVA